MLGSKLKFPDSMDQKEKKEFEDWFNERPAIIQELIIQFPPWEIYILPDLDNDFYMIQSYRENGEGRAVRWDRRTFEPIHEVFGMRIDEFVEHPDSEEIKNHFLRMNQ